MYNHHESQPSIKIINQPSINITSPTPIIIIKMHTLLHGYLMMKSPLWITNLASHT